MSNPRAHLRGGDPLSTDHPVGDLEARSVLAAAYLAGLLGLPGGRARVAGRVGQMRLLRGRPAEALG